MGFSFCQVNRVCSAANWIGWQAQGEPERKTTRQPSHARRHAKLVSERKDRKQEDI
jgi:hypothetical protein